jgi:hypothetical protein
MTNTLRMKFEHPQARVIFGRWEVIEASRPTAVIAGHRPADASEPHGADLRV